MLSGFVGMEGFFLGGEEGGGREARGVEGSS